jgi:hypothetical protein
MFRKSNDTFLKPRAQSMWFNELTGTRMKAILVVSEECALVNLATSVMSVPRVPYKTFF